MFTADLIVLAEGFGAPDRSVAFIPTGLQTVTVRSADELRQALAQSYAVAVVVLDLCVADAATLALLQAPGAPPSIFLLDGTDRWLDAVTAAPSVRDYLPADASPEAVRDTVLRALPSAAVPGVADFSDRDSARLNALGSEVERIARALNELAHEAKDAIRGAETVTAPFVRAIIKRRRTRERYFPAELFSDPAWDMLLDLTAAHLERRLVSVSSLCIAAAVPTTTALRWIRNLSEAGMFERNTDPDDARRTLISLSAATTDRMLDYLVAVRAAG